MGFFTRRNDCGPVEGFIWDFIGFEYCEFEGVKELTRTELLELKRLIETKLGKDGGNRYTSI